MSHTAIPGDGCLAATAQLLCDLLVRRPEYRRRWQRRIQRGALTTPLSQAAVARVIAEHLWDSGERSDTEDALPRYLKDRVGRALNGSVLSAETLRWFVDAFGISEADANRLWAAHTGSGQPSSTVLNSLRHPRPLVARQRHRTVAVFEHHHVGDNAFSIRHTTVHAIAAVTEPIDRYIYVPHVGSVEVEVEHGGRMGRRMPFGGGLSALEILLTRPIWAGETTSLRYATRFTDHTSQCLEYRRFAHGRTENIDIVVTFDRTRLPSRVWRTIWDDYQGGQVLSEERVALDEENSVHWFVGSLEQAVIGFRWQW
jgi:hypothetical protein